MIGYLECAMHMVAYKCARVIGLSLHMEGLVQSLDKGSFPLVKGDPAQLINFSLLKAHIHC